MNTYSSCLLHTKLHKVDLSNLVINYFNMDSIGMDIYEIEFINNCRSVT